MARDWTGNSQVSEFEANSFVCTLWRAKKIEWENFWSVRGFDPSNSKTLTSLIVKIVYFFTVSFYNKTMSLKIKLNLKKTFPYL